MPGAEATGADLAAGLVQAARTAGATDPQVRGADWQTAVVTAVNSDGTVSVGTIRARRLDAYQGATVGDLIEIGQNSSKNWVARGRLTGADIGVGGYLYARKTADTSRASTTTATDDPHLTVTVAANAVYTVEGFMVYLAGATGDIRIGFTAPAGATGAYAMRGPDLAATGGGTTSQVRIQSLIDFTSTIPAGGMSPTYSSAHALGTVVTTGTGGTFAVRWTQNASDPTASVLMTHSWLRLQRMS
ncbi:hypothetical protein [Streptomyces scopuliridis]|uniref:hypothetical protein n=1 Tax=Streptomyces scopuliridis TaxID=452529 RepID=UPI003691983C